MSKKTPAQLDREIVLARENLLRKQARAAIRGLEAHDRDDIQVRIEKIVRGINADGGNKLGIQGDLRREESIEVWDTAIFDEPLLRISIETGEVELR